MTISPPGGLPYHLKEFCATRETNLNRDLSLATGLYGVFVLILCAGWSLLMLVGAAPLLLLGVAEVVSVGPNNYRVRWIRKDSR